jgi:2-iminobutanoate/2-iminopropanoate deaminase
MKQLPKYRGKMMKRLLILLVFTVFSPILLFATGSNSQLHKQAIYTKNAPAPIGPFSQAIRIDNTIYISGQIPIDIKTGELVSGAFNKQARQAITNLFEITKASGGTLDDIVKVTVYITDLANFAVFNQVMAEYFHKPYPARVVIEVKGLPKQAAVEIEAIMKMKKRG